MSLKRWLKAMEEIVLMYQELMLLAAQILSKIRHLGTYFLSTYKITPRTPKTRLIFKNKQGYLPEYYGKINNILGVMIDGEEFDSSKFAATASETSKGFFSIQTKQK